MCGTGHVKHAQANVITHHGYGLRSGFISVGLCMQDYKSLCAAVTIGSTLAKCQACDINQYVIIAEFYKCLNFSFYNIQCKLHMHGTVFSNHSW